MTLCSVTDPGCPLGRPDPTNFLDHPARADWVGKGAECVVVATFRVRPRHLVALLEVEQIADLDSMVDQSGASGVDVRDQM